MTSTLLVAVPLRRAVRGVASVFPSETRCNFNEILGLYPQSAAALRILGLAVVFMFVDNTFAAIFNAIDRQKLYAYVALSGLAINFTLKMVLIPRFGYIGASVARVEGHACSVRRPGRQSGTRVGDAELGERDLVRLLAHPLTG